MDALFATACGILEPALLRAVREARVRGTLVGDRLYPIGTDSKQLSAIFQQIATPAVHAFAKATGRRVLEAGQTSYPDHTVALHEDDPAKIAIDTKCTYRRLGGGMFTMGSYGSYLRDGTRNIRFPYHEYAEHWVIGFLYTRNPAADEAWEPLPMDHPDGHPVPFTDVEVFLAPRHEITGLQPGSGNTRNYGSIRAATAPGTSSLAMALSRPTRLRLRRASGLATPSSATSTATSGPWAALRPNTTVRASTHNSACSSGVRSAARFNAPNACRIPRSSPWEGPRNTSIVRVEKLCARFGCAQRLKLIGLTESCSTDSSPAASRVSP